MHNGVPSHSNSCLVQVNKEHGADNGNARNNPQIDPKFHPLPNPAEYIEPEEVDGYKMKTFRVSLHDEPIAQPRQAEDTQPPTHGQHALL